MKSEWKMLKIVHNTLEYSDHAPYIMYWCLEIENNGLNK